MSLHDLVDGVRTYFAPEPDAGPTVHHDVRVDPRADLQTATQAAAAALAERVTEGTAGRTRVLDRHERAPDGQPAWHIRLEVVPEDLDEDVTVVDLVARPRRTRPLRAAS